MCAVCMCVYVGICLAIPAVKGNDDKKAEIRLMKGYFKQLVCKFGMLMCFVEDLVVMNVYVCVPLHMCVGVWCCRVRYVNW